jgi:putative DNA primase/helicase
VVATGRDEEELEKRLVAAVLDAQPILSVDNVSRPLGGDFLCQLLDRPLLKVRVLGQSAGPRIEPRLIVLATGNNLTLTGDIIRRSVVAHMDAETEEPWQRQFSDNPLGRIMADRGRYVAVALTVCRAFMLAGEPPEKPLPSFGAWSNIVRSALLWLGCGDPVRTMAAASEDDPERQAFGAVLEAWSNVFDDNSVTVAEVVKAACERDSTSGLVNEALHDALAAIAGARSGAIDNRRFGHWLRKNKDRRLDRLMLRRQGMARSHSVRWQVVKTA